MYRRPRLFHGRRGLFVSESHESAARGCACLPIYAAGWLGQLTAGEPVHYLPLYMTMCLAAERDERMLAATTLEAVGFEDLL